MMSHHVHNQAQYVYPKILHQQFVLNIEDTFVHLQNNHLLVQDLLQLDVEVHLFQINQCSISAS